MGSIGYVLDEFNKIEDAPDVSHLDLEVVNVRITQFDNIGEAIIAAAGVNATHGMKRKSGDIATAIAAIIKVEKMMFMETNYKLNKRVIMRTVNCSTTSYNRETKDLRSNLLKQRNFDMRKFYADGMSQRDIGACVGVDHKTVSNILGGEFEPMVETAKEDGSGEFEPMVEIPQEESSSIFRHVTSVVPIENPWGPKKTPTTTIEDEPAVISAVTLDTNTSQSIIKMFNTLGHIEKDELLLILSDMAENF
jgi:DNA-binding XRE family transcriptional regulator